MGPSLHRLLVKKMTSLDMNESWKADLDDEE